MPWWIWGLIAWPALAFGVAVPLCKIIAWGLGSDRDGVR